MIPFPYTVFKECNTIHRPQMKYKAADAFFPVSTRFFKKTGGRGLKKTVRALY